MICFSKIYKKHILHNYGASSFSFGLWVSLNWTFLSVILFFLRKLILGDRARDGGYIWSFGCVKVIMSQRRLSEASTVQQQKLLMRTINYICEYFLLHLKFPVQKGLSRIHYLGHTFPAGCSQKVFIKKLCLLLSQSLPKRKSDFVKLLSVLNWIPVAPPLMPLYWVLFRKNNKIRCRIFVESLCTLRIFTSLSYCYSGNSINGIKCIKISESSTTQLNTRHIYFSAGSQ